jgi:hypothetical protein
MRASAGAKAGSNHEDSQLRQESPEARGRKILAAELKRRHWTERELKARRKSDPEKLAMATRLRKETILPKDKTLCLTPVLETMTPNGITIRVLCEGFDTNPLNPF